MHSYEGLWAIPLRCRFRATLYQLLFIQRSCPVCILSGTVVWSYTSPLGQREGEGTYRSHPRLFMHPPPVYPNMSSFQQSTQEVTEEPPPQLTPRVQKKTPNETKLILLNHAENFLSNNPASLTIDRKPHRSQGRGGESGKDPQPNLHDMDADERSPW